MAQMKYVVAYDGSESSIHSLETMLAKSSFAHKPESIEVETAEAKVKERLEKAKRVLGEAVTRIKHEGGSSIVLHTEVGDARVVICRVCEDVAADGLFVGTRGHSELTGFLLGSVTQYCVHHVTCPITITK